MCRPEDENPFLDMQLIDGLPTYRRANSAGWLSVARREIQGLTTPIPSRYWVDYTLSILVGYSAGAYYLVSEFGSWASILALAIAAFATYRAAMFLHELVHFRGNEMQGFKWFWNLTGGVVMLMPSFLYESHLSHHSSQHYGTDEDGEYLPLGLGTLAGVLLFLGQSLLLPVFVFLRFLVGTPVSFVHPKLRKLVVERASSFVIDFRYRRKLSEQLSPTTWVALEWLCWLRAVVPIAAITLGLMPWTRLSKLYLLAVVAILINHLRTLAAHRYLSDGAPMNHEEQFMDSTNIRGGWFTELICPVGLRYHALHHLFPAIPYHNLGRAHRQLIDVLPADSDYRQTEFSDYSAVVASLIRHVVRRRH